MDKDMRWKLLFQDREDHSSRGPYGLRRRTTPSKRLRDCVLEGEATSGVAGHRRKKARLQHVATASRGTGTGTVQTEGGDGDRTAEPSNPAGTQELSSFRAETSERREREAALQESC